MLNELNDLQVTQYVSIVRDPKQMETDVTVSRFCDSLLLAKQGEIYVLEIPFQ